MGVDILDGETEETALLRANLSDDNTWRDSDGIALPVSASDLERHEYCPLSWSLSRQGNSGQGEAIVAGIKRHTEIHEKMKSFQEIQSQKRRSITIWTWWFSVIIALSIDAIAFNYIDEVVTPIIMAQYLTMWSFTTLLVGFVTISVPWRSWIGLDETISRQKTKFLATKDDFTYFWEPKGFIGGWFEAGRIEASLLFGSIVLGLHAIALAGAKDREQATFILFITAMIWTLAASWQLQRMLLSENVLQTMKQEIDIDTESEVAYSDDDSNSHLLVDEKIGLRGRPDQIVIVDGEFIPFEQKTGKVPINPHPSHRMQLLAYLHLVEINTKKSSPYGVLRYGKENLHQIPWNDFSKQELRDAVTEVQRLMVQGGAIRNHNRPGKCRNCSRLYACDESLV
ncbi:MAG TPA: Dna2/Cas4 domain-containing protein [Candidatus Poseidoniaceae archaeon]|nr:Dna2/Cas4 domain-containing protein [Candidatus Poseidoniaceae archaeon]